MAYRAPEAFQVHTSQLVLRGFWQTTGLMLVGMGLFKLGVLSAERSTRFYAWLTGLGFGLGLPIAWYSTERGRALHWDLADFMLVRSQLGYWSDLAVGLGWIGLVMLLCRAGWRARAVAAVGRTALSNYLLQTVVCTTIFYGTVRALRSRGPRGPAPDRAWDLVGRSPGRCRGPPLRGRPGRVDVALGRPPDAAALALAIPVAR